MAVNHKPIVRGTDTGIWRRLKLVPFTETIPEAEQDKALPEKLVDEDDGELPGILNWALAGLAEWQASGLNQPDEVTAATADYRAEMDIAAKFIDECCIVGKSSSEGRRAIRGLRRMVRSIRQVRGMDSDFGTSMAERGFEKRKISVYYYHGIGLASVLQHDENATRDSRDT